MDTKYDDELPSFWSIARGKLDLDFVRHHNTETRRRIIKRQKIGQSQAYGIGYEWITEPKDWCSLNGFCWHDSDHYFKGASQSEISRVLKNPNNHNACSRKRKLEDLFCEPEIVNYPNETFAKTSGLPSSEEMAGSYDIIFYGGLYENMLRHHRTARGSLNLTCIDGALEGTVEMDACMEKLDVIPFGGQFTFKEMNRIQRIHLPAQQQAPSSSNGTGVIQIDVTKAPNGLYKYQQFQRVALNRKCTFTGEMRVFRTKTPTGLAIETEPDDYHHDQDSSKYEYNTVEAAEASLKSHYEKTCSWLHTHTGLPNNIATKVGEFLTPPPFFFFEEGDVCLDVNWSCGLPNGGATSCIIARRRPQQHHINSQEPVIPTVKFAENIVQREMNDWDNTIHELEMKKDFSRFAYQCYRKHQTTKQFKITFDADFEKQSAFNRIVRCLIWFDVDFFNKLLAKYNLRYESHGLYRTVRYNFAYIISFSAPHEDKPNLITKGCQQQMGNKQDYISERNQNKKFKQFQKRK